VLFRPATRVATGMLAATIATTAAPQTALASTGPTITDPGRPSLATGRPWFSWTLGLAGEQVTSISIGRSAQVDADGQLAWQDGGRQVAVEEAATSTRVRVPLHAGTWFWTAAWSGGADADQPTAGHTQPRSFTIDGRLRTIRGSYVQFDTLPALLARGTLDSNLRAAVVTCSVHQVPGLVSRTRVRIAPRTSGRTSFTCPRLRVPERLDGRLLTLRVVARGGGLRSTAVTRFRAT
jgi:hypothetical protein